MKNRGLMVGIIIVVGVLIGFTVYFKQQAQTISKSLDAERYSRLVAEEKVVNTASKLKEAENDLKASEEKIAKIQTVLKDQKNVNEELEQQFERLSKAKTDLENQLKTVVAAPPTPVQTTQPAKTQDMAVVQASK